MIEVQEITKQYGDKVVLDKVGLQFNKGKITSLIGGNGAGKSTLLSVISRLLSQDGGVVLVDEKNVTEYKSKVLAQRLSILKQSNHVRLKLTVRELVSFGRFPYSQEKLNKEDILRVDQLKQNPNPLLRDFQKLPCPVFCIVCPTLRSLLV
jgi:iron complex transport system ATP-binding protein